MCCPASFINEGRWAVFFEEEQGGSLAISTATPGAANNGTQLRIPVIRLCCPKAYWKGEVLLPKLTASSVMSVR